MNACPTPLANAPALIRTAFSKYIPCPQGVTPNDLRPLLPQGTQVAYSSGWSSSRWLAAEIIKVTKVEFVVKWGDAPNGDPLTTTFRVGADGLISTKGSRGERFAPRMSFDVAGKLALQAETDAKASREREGSALADKILSAVRSKNITPARLEALRACLTSFS